MPTPPPLSKEQRRAAYAKALELRRQRAMLKTQLSSDWHPLDFTGAWERPEAQGMKVMDLLTALPGIGKPTALRLLEQAGFKHPEKSTVRSTGPRQREKLFELLQR